VNLTIAIVLALAPQYTGSKLNLMDEALPARRL
jgi:hypothetical protein